MRMLVLTTTFPRWHDDTVPGFVYELSKRLSESELEIVVLAPHFNGAERFEIMDGMEVFRFPYFYPKKYQKLAYNGGIIPNIKKSNLSKLQIPFLVLCELFYAYKIIKSEKIDIIHSHWVIPNGLVGAAFKKIYGIKHVTTAHAGDVFTIRNSLILRRITRCIFRNSDAITANSEYTKKIILSIDNTMDHKVKIIPMGVDTSRFSPKSRSDLKKSFDSEYLILSVGRLVDKKGIEYLIESMKYVIKRHPNIKLIIGGSGPERERLEKLSENLNIENNIVFVGYISSQDLPKYYASSDIFILPSIITKENDTEGLGVVLLEAMASGTPVVGSNIGGITDIIADGVNGFLSNPGDSKSIADKILKILEDEKLRSDFSNDGIKTVEEKFSWCVVSNRFFNLISELI